MQKRLELENEYLREEVTQAGAFGELIGQSPALEAVARQIDLVAPTDSAVLILGESGTGKELVAREIHRRSKRAAKPLIKVNCAAVPRELYESEFFGHARGAFTGALRDRAGRFELADGGTLFLDEVGRDPAGTPGEAAARAAGGGARAGRRGAHPEGERAADRGDQPRPAGRGRGRAVPAGPVLPAQRVPGRTAAAAQAAGRHPAPGRALPAAGRPQARPAEAATDAGERAAAPAATDWPGNVRELQHVIERAVITSDGGRLAIELPAGPAAGPAQPSPGRRPPTGC